MTEGPGGGDRAAPPSPGRARVRIMAIAVALAVALGAVAALWAGRGRAKAQKAVLHGTVIDAMTGQAIPGAIFRFDQPGGDLTVTSGRDGRYRARIDTSRAIAFTVDAPAHAGTVAFGKLCPGEDRLLEVRLDPAGPAAAPPGPIILAERASGPC